MVHTPGMKTSVIWSTDGSPADSTDPTAALQSVIPAPGESVMLVVDLAPDAVMASPDFDPEQAFAEQGAASPGLVELFEPENPGFHTTPTIDYFILLDGELHLELDNGEERLVKAGDVVIQNATRHRWRNETDRPARFAVVLVGAPA
jgi:mannose-6-phosphate isomerase-like protein (cupin superfamily)